MPPTSSLRSLVLLLAVAVVAVGCDGFETGTAPDSQSTGTPSVEFASSSVGAIPSDSLVTLDVQLQNPDGNAVTVQLLYAQQASSAAPVDLANSIDRITEISFAATSGDTTITRPVEIDISDADISDGRKEAFFALQQVESDGAARLGEQNEVSLSIGFPPVEDVKAAGVGASVTFEAIVTEISDGDLRVQDETAGFWLAGQDELASEASRGDLLRVSGTISEFSGQLQFFRDELNTYTIVSSENDLPDAETVTLSEADENFDQLQSQRIRVENITIEPGGDSNFQGGGSEGNYTVTDEQGNTLTLRIPGDSFYAGKPIPTGSITFEGVLGQFFGDIQLRARYEDNLITE